jgi:hypothetical protein
MLGKSRDGFQRWSRTEKAENEGIDETPPGQGIGARRTAAVGRALGCSKIAQSLKKEKLLR